MNSPEKEVTALNSTVFLTREIADLREALRNLIVVGKRIALKLPSAERRLLIDEMFKADSKLKKT